MSKPVAGNGYRISRAGSAQTWRVSSGILSEIHEILLQEPSAANSRQHHILAVTRNLRRNYSDQSQVSINVIEQLNQWLHHVNNQLEIEHFYQVHLAIDDIITKVEAVEQINRVSYGNHSLAYFCPYGEKKTTFPKFDIRIRSETNGFGPRKSGLEFWVTKSP
ncbi:unnamed protein product [Adineta ricciae]|uniref:Uncharacterized protein n=1 Tax=Adineta ricciae TaxID=249248 RepID=A0A816E122_ADIRI|nr:unnamed protein product [Adineta ricciae]CAF1640799.1 unnamed protein product [Adineta ricciae]